VIAFNLADEWAAEGLVERVPATLVRPIVTSTGSHPISANIGRALFPMLGAGRCSRSSEHDDKAPGQPCRRVIGGMSVARDTGSRTPLSVHSGDELHHFLARSDDQAAFSHVGEMEDWVRPTLSSCGRDIADTCHRKKIWPPS
jgi:hypothetical protein